MHSYSIDRELRTKVTIIIFVISMCISIGLNILLGGMIQNIEDYIGKSKFSDILQLLKFLEVNSNIIGVPIIYAILSLSYNNCLWKNKWLKKLHQIPDISGEWKGELISTFNRKTIKMELTIEQKWNKILFSSNFPETNSRSHSNVAAIYVEAPGNVVIYFGYKNDSYDINSNMQTHFGYNILNLISETEIEAKYFNDRDNPDPNIKGGNKGVFKLAKC